MDINFHCLSITTTSKETFSAKLVYSLYTMRHPMFISRTVLVKNNNVEEAMNVLNKILGSEGVFDDYKRCLFYEKPWQTRKRINFERCKAIYNEEMTRKIKFLARKNRTPPYPGCY